MASDENSPADVLSSADTTLKITREVNRRPRVGVRFGAMTHIGKVRKNNEDQYLVASMAKSLKVLSSSLPDDEDALLTSKEGYLLLVADGMGGAGGGELASAFVIESAKRHVVQTAKWFFHLDDPDEQRRDRDLQDELTRLDRELIEMARQNPALAGMGTTLTAARSIDDEVVFLHVGDSRVYLFRHGELDQLTRDHTLTQHLVDAGLIRSEDARRHRLRHVLTNVIGGQPGVRGEIGKLRVADGDRILLCTDGLNGAVDDARIAELLARTAQPEEACRALIDAALEGGGRDNVTVVLADYSVQPE